MKIKQITYSFRNSKALWFVAIGLPIPTIVLLGWILGNESMISILPGFSSMKINTAISLIAIYSSILLLGLPFEFKNKKSLISFLNLPPLLFGSATLIQYFYGLELQIDQLIAPDPFSDLYPGRISMSASFNLILVSIALNLYNHLGSAHKKIIDSIAVSTLLLVLPNIISYSWGIHDFFNPRNTVPIAFHTALSFAIIALGILFLDDKDGVIQQFYSKSIGTLALRRLLPKVTIAIYILGFIAYKGSVAQFYPSTYGMVIIVLGATLISTYLMWNHAKSLNKIEAARLQAEDKAQIAKFELQLIETQKKSENELKDLMDRLNLALSSAKMAAWEKDLKTNSTWYSSNHHEIFGYLNTSQEVSEKELHAQIIPADQQRVQESLRRALSKGFSNIQFQVLREDGNTSWIEQHIKTFYDEKYQPSHMIGIVMDISDRKVADQALYRAMQDISLYKSALDQTAIVSFSDPQGQITFANERFCEVSGYPTEKIIGQNYKILSSGYHPREFYQSLWGTICQGNSWRGEMCNKTKSGNIFWVDACIVPIFDIKGEIEGFFTVQFDITERKLAEEKLIQSAKMSSLGEMAAGIAHEVNTPLAVIHGKAALLSLKLEMNQLDKELFSIELEKITQTTDRIAKIIRGLKTFSRSSKQDPMSFTPIKQIVEDTLELCNEKFRHHGVMLKVDLQTDTRLNCRSTEISQVILNLLTNSLDAVMNLPEKWVELAVKAEGDFILISVTDSGDGIPQEVVNNMMQPFFTTKDIGKGTGLGLSISKGIAESHQGMIYYDANSTKTRFVLKLPLKQTEVTEPKAA